MAGVAGAGVAGGVGGPSATNMFALIIPGRAVDTNFQPVDAQKLMTAIVQPAAVSEFLISLLQPALPPDQAVAVYFSIPGNSDFADWQYVGNVSTMYPTSTFRSPWHGKIHPATPVVQIGLSVEATSLLATLPSSTVREEELALDSARGIAQDLFLFMQSFAQSTQRIAGMGNDVLVIPTDCIDRWYNKFTHKHQLEPFFWMKKDVNKRSAA